MSFETWVGLFASTLTAISLLPQLIKVAKEKKSGDVSVVMLVTLFTGLCCWVFYGILKEDWIIIVSNSVSMIINGISTLLVLKYK